MLIKVKDISPSGLLIDRTVGAGEIALEDDEDFKTKSPLTIMGKIERAGDELVAQVVVSGNFEFSCGRCLETLEQKRDEKLQLYFDIEKETDVINLGEDIRQELILNFSNVFLCDENCRGLCPHCGANLNKEECDCGKYEVKSKK